MISLLVLLNQPVFTGKYENNPTRHTKSIISISPNLINTLTKVIYCENWVTMIKVITII